MRLLLRASIFVHLIAGLLTPAAHADDSFYRGKRLTILVNYAAGGPTDV